MDAFQNLERWLHTLQFWASRARLERSVPFRSVPNAPVIVKECRLCWQLARLWDRDYIFKRSRQGYYKRSLQLKRSCQTEDASQPHHFIVHIKCTGMQWFCSRKIQHLLSELLKKLIFIRESGADGQSHCDGESAARGRGWCGEAQSVSSRPSCRPKGEHLNDFFLSFCFGSSSLEVSCADQCQMIRYVNLGVDHQGEEEARSHPTVPWAHHYARWRCHLSLGRVCIQHLAPLLPSLSKPCPALSNIMHLESFHIHT